MTARSSDFDKGFAAGVQFAADIAGNVAARVDVLAKTKRGDGAATALIELRDALLAGISAPARRPEQEDTEQRQ